MSEVILDTITGKSTATTITIGSTPVVSASANSMTIRGEGSAQTSIQQGLCKWWIYFNQDAGSGSQNLDSFNVGSVSDGGTGDFRPTYTSNMASANYSVSILHQAEVTNEHSTEYTADQATTTTRLITVENNAGRDKASVGASAVGDLA